VIENKTTKMIWQERDSTQEPKSEVVENIFYNQYYSIQIIFSKLKVIDEIIYLNKRFYR
jgi:hypothetical protein